MKRSRQTHGEIEARRRKAEEWRRIQTQRAAERQRLRDYKIALARDEVAVDTTRLAPSNSYSTPDFVLRGTYRPEPFVCKDCGVAEVWTPLQQKWWYETAKGDVFTAAVRCRACRTRERAQIRRTPRASGRTRKEEASRLVAMGVTSESHFTSDTRGTGAQAVNASRVRNVSLPDWFETLKPPVRGAGGEEPAKETCQGNLSRKPLRPEPTRRSSG